MLVVCRVEEGRAPACASVLLSSAASEDWLKVRTNYLSCRCHEGSDSKGGQCGVDVTDREGTYMNIRGCEICR